MMGRGLALLLCAVTIVSLHVAAVASNYVDPADGMIQGDDDVELSRSEYEEPVDLQILQDVGKRACIRRGGNCDHRPNDCCHSSSCRCNLWGSNCRCQRMGLFQKWG